VVINSSIESVQQIMTTSKEIQDSRLTSAERRVKRANDYLSEELDIKIKIVLIGDRLYIRKTLPSRPGSSKTEWHQQTITLGLTANSKGVEQAIKDVMELNNLLAQRKFDWKTWNQYLCRPCKHRVRQSELIGKQVEKFKEHFLSLPKDKLTREDAWKANWAQYFNKLPFDQYLTDEVISDAISQKTEEASANREKFCAKLKRFLKFLDFETRLNLTALGKGYTLPPVTGDELPTDEQILAALDLIKDPEWRTAYMLQAVFGLRNHEIFFLDRGKTESFKGITVLSVPDETKTGFHPVAALYPEWFDNEEWNLQTAKLPEVEVDLEKTTLAKIGKKVTAAFRKFGIPFSPYKLRHAWARRAIEFGFNDETAAEFMGHSVEIHRDNYHRLIAMKHGLRIAQSFMSNPDRPKPPQR
jgi:integrase